jgi:hypothetical protein
LHSDSDDKATKEKERRRNTELIKNKNFLQNGLGLLTTRRGDRIAFLRIYSLLFGALDSCALHNVVKLSECFFELPNA